MKVTDGTRVHEFNWLLTGDAEMYAHEGGQLYLWSPSKRKHIGIEAVGMKREELLRAISAATALLSLTEPAPANRHERRAQAKAVH